MSLVHIILVIVVLALLIAFHEFGHFICAKALGVPVKVFSVGFPMGTKPLLSFKWGETDCQLNPLPLGGFCAFMDDEPPEADAETTGEEKAEAYDPNDQRFLKNRKIWERSIIISGGVVANIIIAYIILVGLVFTTGVPSEVIDPGVMVGDVIADSPASRVGFQVGDKILKINQKSVNSPAEMQEAVKQSKAKALEVEIIRQKKPMVLKPTPTAEGTIGVQIGSVAKKRPIANWVEPFTYAGRDLVNMSVMLSEALWNLVRGALPLNQVGGLVKVVEMGSKVSQTGFIQLLYFAALISIELAILNILPIPALDGGHLFLLVIEALRGRPLPRKAEETLHYAGFMILIGLGVFLIFKDIWGLAVGQG